MNSKVAIILGMHRSGTSAITGAIRSMGFELGGELIEPNFENSKGFFENREIVSFNDRLLFNMSLSWDSVGFIWEENFNSIEYEKLVSEAQRILQENFLDASFWAVKDPRLCILLPFWQKVLKRLGVSETNISYIICLRNPLESFYSQKRRNELDPSFHIVGSELETFLLMWYTYIRKALLAIIPDRCLCVSYERMLDDPAHEYMRIAGYLGVRPNTDAVDQFVDSFIDQGLNHNVSTLDELIIKTERVKFVSDLYLGLKEKDEASTISAEHLQRLIDSTMGFEALKSFYLVHVQRLYGKLYHQHLQTRNMLNIENRNRIESETRLFESENLYKTVVNSRRWRLISALCSILGR
jgi:hypothetical protein